MMFKIFRISSLFLLMVLNIAGANAETTGNVTLSFSKATAIPGENLQLSVTPSDITDSYAVTPDFGGLLFTNVHTADHYENENFVMMTAEAFTIAVQVPSDAPDGTTYTLNALFWTDVTDKKNTDSLSITVQWESEIDIQGNGTSIPNFDTTPSLDDHTDFNRAMIPGKPVVRTFTILNTGMAILNLTNESIVEVSGPNAADFTITTETLLASLPPGESQDFQIAFAPTEEGVKSATITVANDDPDENPFTFDIQGLGVWSPDIEIMGNGLLIPDEDATPSLDDHTDFGLAVLPDESVIRTFTILNTGFADLNLTGTPLVEITGPNASDFAILRKPLTPIAVDQQQTFQIVFAPMNIGIKTATVSIFNDDADETPYNFMIQGTALDIPKPEIDIQGNGNTIENGDNSPSLDDHTDFGMASFPGEGVIRTFTIFNIGTAELNLTGLPRIEITGPYADNFNLILEPQSPIAIGKNQTFQIRFTPSTEGEKTATVNIPNDDGDENPYTFAIKGSGSPVPVPEISIQGNGISIDNGDITPSPDDHTDFGSVLTSAAPVERTFTILNSGTGDLTLTGTPLIAISGANAGDFTVTTFPSSPIHRSESTTFMVAFSPSEPGERLATLSIANDDADENPYHFTIKGTGLDPVPEMNVRGNAVSIRDGDTTPSLDDHTDFGSAFILSEPVERTFTIVNIGYFELRLTGTPMVEISGEHSEDFNITQFPNTPIAPSGKTTFKVAFTPKSQGEKLATLSIANTDSNENPYNFDIRGMGVKPEPEINLVGNGVSIRNGDTTPSLADHTHFGSMLTSVPAIVRTFSIVNSGIDLLTLNGTPIIEISGANAGDFSVTELPIVAIEPGQSTRFKISFSPSSGGDKTASVLISNTDADENPFAFIIKGIGIDPKPEIDVQGNGLSISNGDSMPSTGDDTDFGSLFTNETAVERTFTIVNTGTGELTLTGSPLVEISGANAQDFTVTVFPASGIAPSERTTFSIAFDPATQGEKTATLSIGNTDDNENPYTFAIKGTGINPESEMDIQGNGMSIPNGDTTPCLTDHTHFGAMVVLTDSPLSRTFTIVNSGTQILTLTGTPLVSISGVNANDFTLTTEPSEIIAIGATSSFTLAFRPTSEGQKTARVSIANNDSDENPYTFAIYAIGTLAPEPEIDIQGNGSTIPDGDISPSLGDYTDFGSALISLAPITRTFTIQNIGTASLNLTQTPAVELRGLNANDFSVSVQPASSIEAKGSAVFQVIFNPKTSGEKTARIRIYNNDTDENPYTFDIRGIGVSLSEIETKIHSDDAASGDGFGTSVSISGDYVIVGAPNRTDTGLFSGAAYIFRRDGGDWTQEAKLTPGEGTSEDYFGMSVAISGETAVVGAPGDDDSGDSAGAVYVFKRMGGYWIRQAKLTPADDYDHFGTSVVIDGESMIAGAPYDRDNGIWAGAAYIFRNTEGTWELQAKLRADDGSADDRFGSSVFIHGTYAIVGAYGNDDLGDFSGSAYVFMHDGITWTQTAKLIPNDGTFNDRFGISVSMRDDYAVIGASGDDADAGSVYVFKRSDSGWVEALKFSDETGVPNDLLGCAVSVWKDRIIAGSQGYGGMNPFSGSAILFSPVQAGSLRLIPMNLESGDSFGRSVSISDYFVIIGADGNNDMGTSAGAAYIYPIDREADLPPTISPIDDRLVSRNPPDIVIEFTLNDRETLASELTIRKGSSDPSLVDAEDMMITANESQHTLTIKPKPNASGITTLTLEADDGVNRVSESFTLTVNDLPSVTDIPDQSVASDGSGLSLNFSVNDTETPSGELLITLASSNATVVPNSNILLQGSGSNRILNIYPIPDSSGTPKITVQINDGISTVVDTFQITVTLPDYPPVISKIDDRTTLEDTPLDQIKFTVSDSKTPASQLRVYAKSSNTELVPQMGLELSGTTENRTLRIIPTPDAWGYSDITILVSDGINVQSTKFMLTVVSVNDLPQISFIPDQLLYAEMASNLTVNFTIYDVETPSDQLGLKGYSSNTSVIPDDAIRFQRSGNSVSAALTPKSGVYGTSILSINVSDPEDTNIRTFRFEYKTQNSPPWISDIPDQTIPDNTSTGTISFTVGDNETPATQLVVTVESSNTALVPADGIESGGSGTSRAIAIIPAKNQTGTAVITVTVNDGDITVAETFGLTVNLVVQAGDVDNNDEIDLADAILALKIAAGIEATSIYAMADVDGDGSVGIREAIFVLIQISEF